MLTIEIKLKHGDAYQIPFHPAYNVFRAAWFAFHLLGITRKDCDWLYIYLDNPSGETETIYALENVK